MSETTEQELEKVKETLTLVRIDLGSINTKLDMIKDMNQKLDEVGKVANKALDSSSSSHHRLDEIRDKTFPAIESTMKEMRETQERGMDKMKENQKWLIVTGISVVGLFIAFVTLLWTMKH